MQLIIQWAKINIKSGPCWKIRSQISHNNCHWISCRILITICKIISKDCCSTLSSSLRVNYKTSSSTIICYKGNRWWKACCQRNCMALIIQHKWKSLCLLLWESSSNRRYCRSWGEVRSRISVNNRVTVGCHLICRIFECYSHYITSQKPKCT